MVSVVLCVHGIHNSSPQLSNPWCYGFIVLTKQMRGEGGGGGLGGVCDGLR